MNNIVIIGKTGSGKTTVGKQLAQKLDLPHLSSGDIARDMARDDPSTKQALDHGLMAPEAAMRAAIKQELEKAVQTKGGFILDGFPRTVGQLICVLKWIGADVEFFHLQIDDIDAILRLLSRNREDDNPDAIARKLENFETETQPLIRIAQPIEIFALTTVSEIVDTIQDRLIK